MALVNIDPTTGQPVSKAGPTNLTNPGPGDRGPDPGSNVPPGFRLDNQGQIVPIPSGGFDEGATLAPQADAGRAAAPRGAEVGTATVDEGNLSGVGIGPTDAVTREVQDEELVSNQLEGLLSGDSRFIQNARRRAAELSNRRGQFTSNLFAGAAERSAIEAALPIAQNDAQAYRDAASQNLVARNQNAIANIQRAAQLDTSLLSSRTSISLGNLDAATRVSIANMDNLTRINIANLDAETQTNIANMNSKLQTNLADLQSRTSRYIADQSNLTSFVLQEDRQAFEAEQNQIAHDLTVRSSHINMSMQAQINYINYLASFAGTEMDANAASRLQQQADAQLVATFAMINGLYPNQPPIDVQFNTLPGGG